MRNLSALFAMSFFLIFGCSQKERKEVITIVDIGYLDRSELARQIQVINKYSPKLIALDFMLTADSLEKDTLIMKVLAKTPNVIHSTVLRKPQRSHEVWDSLETYHAKFGGKERGFSNFTITDDSVIVTELPMRQYYRDEIQHALSYMIAEKAFGVRSPFNHDDSDCRDFVFDRSDFRKDFKIISSTDLLVERFKREDLGGKIVMLGHASGDPFYLDHDHNEKISGVEIQANFVMQIIDWEAVDGN